MNRRTHAASIAIASNSPDVVESTLARAISLLPFALLFIGTLLWADARSLPERADGPVISVVD